MLNIPLYISLLFAATAFATLLFLYRAAGNQNKIFMVILPWMVLQTIISLTGFYTVNGMPPRLLLLIVPPVLFIITLFNSAAGRRFTDSLDLRQLTLLHIIRIPVEIVLLLLSLHHAIPQLMTFEGINFDIISGITAPIMYYVAFRKKQPGRIALLAWNFICLGLLFNIVIHAILSVPTPFQQFALDQPAIAVQYFPFVWLPSAIVPIVLYTHLASIRQLLRLKNS